MQSLACTFQFSYRATQFFHAAAISFPALHSGRVVSTRPLAAIRSPSPSATHLSHKGAP